MYGGHFYEDSDSDKSNSDEKKEKKGEWVGNLDLFVRLIDPLSIFEVQKSDFLATTRVKEKIDAAIKSAAKALPKHHRGMKSALLPDDDDLSDYLPIIIDSGASISITPVLSDFIGPITPLPRQTVKGLNHVIKIEGIGRVRWRIVDSNGRKAVIETTAYYIPGGDVRLFSPQCHLQENKNGSFVCKADGTTFSSKDTGDLRFLYHECNNLPLATIDRGKHSGHLAMEQLEDLGTDRIQLSVADETNQNLTGAQKELLGWHWKLGHANMPWIQKLMRPKRPKHKKHFEPEDVIAAVIHTNIENTRTCASADIVCCACQLAKQRRRGTRTGRVIPIEPGRLMDGDLQPGDCVSLDHFESRVRGRLPNTKGKEKERDRYCGGLIAVDHASGYIYVNCQVSLRAGDTIDSKKRFEIFAKKNGVKIKKYHADNGTFNSEAFRTELANLEQELDFSGVGAHHQNGVAERAIQTITKWARAMVLHAAIHWPEEADLALWPFAVEYAAFIWNHLPREDTHLSPVEIFTGTKSRDYSNILRTHVWGCPVYVLDPRLQDGKKVPKWQPRSKRGQFLGFSPDHSSTIGRIRNVSTGNVSPQFHIVYDDYFTSVPNADNGGVEAVVQENVDWESLIEAGRERHVELEIDQHGNQLNIPELAEEWLTPDELGARQQRERRINARGRMRRRNLRQAPDPQEEKEELEIDDELIPDSIADEDEFIPAEPEEVSEDEISATNSLPDHENTGRPRRRAKPVERYGEWIMKAVFRGRKVGSQTDIDTPRSEVHRIESRKIRYEEINHAFLSAFDWTKTAKQVSSVDARRYLVEIEMELDPEFLSTENWNPLALQMKASSEDNPTWDQAMHGHDADGYWIAMKKEISSLEKLKAWEIVDRPQDKLVIGSTWAFRRKLYPDGSVRKLKARICCRGDQEPDSSVFDTYAPVVSWTTVRLLYILTLKLGLTTKQVDYTNAFVQADIHDEEVYVSMPRGFSLEGKVMKLKKSLYGLRESPKNFFEHLKSKLIDNGFEQSSEDPCLFKSEKVICLVYVDDCLFFSAKEEYIDEKIDGLRNSGLLLDVEDDVSGFLGVLITKKEDGSIELLQTGLIGRIIKALGIEDANSKATPAETTALPAEPDGQQTDGDFNYRSLIGMLGYLTGNSRPELAFAHHQCARYSHAPRRIHEVALKRIGRYLIATKDRGLIMRPTDDVKLECYVDADFAGLWGSEDPNNANAVKSRTGYVIMIGGSPVLWASKMQTETAMSTMESEYVALSAAMKDLIPVRRLLNEVCDATGLEQQREAVMKASLRSTTKVHEDNAGCLILANTPLPYMTPRSKHYGTKYHWFRSHVGKTEEGSLEVVKVDTKINIADIFTKGLTKLDFERLRFMLCGW
jgi:hypothetical protein